MSGSARAVRQLGAAGGAIKESQGLVERAFAPVCFPYSRFEFAEVGVRRAAVPRVSRQFCAPSSVPAELSSEFSSGEGPSVIFGY